MHRIGMLTSGGDCQALNTALRAIAKTLYNEYPELELIGFSNGFSGLLYGDCRIMKPDDFSGLMVLGGSILESSAKAYHMNQEIFNPTNPNSEVRITAMAQSVKNLKLDGLIVLGGHGSQITAKLLSEFGVPVITLPKTINNDICGTELSIGFVSASEVASMVIDSIRTTASAHGRIFIIEMMGGKTGWLALQSGIASAADIILIPEIPYNLHYIAQALEIRRLRHKTHTIIVIAEGALSSEEAAMTEEQLSVCRQDWRFPSIGWQLSSDIKVLTDQEIRVNVPGHFLRGGHPDPYDRVLASMLGTTAGQMAINNDYGCMIGFQHGKATQVPLKEFSNQLNCVSPDNLLVNVARTLGVSFGDQPPL